MNPLALPRPHGWQTMPHTDDGGGRPAAALWKQFDGTRRACSTALFGGGMVRIGWVVNATVSASYFHPDPLAHARGIPVELGMEGDGACMLTAVDVAINARWAEEQGVIAMATAGISSMCQAAAPAVPFGPGSQGHHAGTINIVLEMPVAMSPAAMVNLVMTATEAKAQYFAESGHAATGTPTDAIVVVCPDRAHASDSEYGGPRSRWGSVAARVVLAALHARDRELLL
jgi:adenosylcobinamide hydrolase